MSRLARLRRRPIVVAALVLLAALVVLVLLAPRIAERVVAWRLVAGIEEGRELVAQIERVELGWDGRALLAGLDVRQTSGERVARLERLEGRVEPRPALGGRIRAQAALRGLELDLERDAAGRWSFEPPPGEERRPPPRRPPGRGAEPLDLVVELELEDLRVRLATPEGESEASLSAGRLRVDTTGGASLADLRVELARDGAPAGSLRLAGELAGLALPGLDPAALEGALELVLADVALALLAPLLPAERPFELAAGTLAGSWRLAREGAGAPAAPLLDGEARVDGLVLERDAGEPVRYAPIVLRATATPGAEGVLALHGSLRAEGLAQLDASGRWDPAPAARTLDAELRASLALAGLAPWIAGALPGTPPQTVDGAFVLQAELALAPQEDGERATRFRASGELGDLRIQGAGDPPTEELFAAAAFDFAGRGSPSALRVEGTLTPHELRMPDARLAAAPLRFLLTRDRERRGERLAAELLCEELRVGFEDGRELVQRQLVVEGLARTTPSGALELERALARTRTASVLARGELRAQAQATELDLALRLEARLEDLVRDLADFVQPPGLAARGALSVDARVHGTAAEPRVEGTSLLEELELELPAEEGPVEVVEPRVEVEHRLALLAGALVLEEVAIDSESLRGTIEGTLHGGAPRAGDGAAEQEPAPRARVEALAVDLEYVPERAGALLAHWMPATLGGSEWERIELRLDGPLGESPLLTLLEEGVGEARVGLGQLEVAGLVLGGELRLELAAGAARALGALSANGGRIDLDAALELGEPAEGVAPEGGAARIDVAIADLALDRELAPLLALLHPIFGGLAEVEAARLDGLLSGELDLVYGAPLSAEGLLAGWAALPKQPFSGAGELRFERLFVQGSPLLARLLQILGEGGAREIDIEPLEFVVREGLVSYAEPWTWTLGGVETTFGGTIGLDGALDMTATIPVDERLVERYSALAPLAGKAIEIPLRGTTAAPELAWQAALAGLATEALGGRLREELGLGEGRSIGEALRGPTEMLERADALWEAGEREEARALYRRIRDEHSRSLVYLLNRERIKAREK